MGDIVSLVEKAQSVVDESEAIRMQEKMAKNTFDLQDYLDQLNSMDKMGSLDQLLEMIPGAKVRSAKMTLIQRKFVERKQLSSQ